MESLSVCVSVFLGMFFIYVGEGSCLSSLELWYCHLRCWPRSLNRGHIFPWNRFSELHFHTLFWVCTLCPCSAFVAKCYCFSTAGHYSTFLLHERTNVCSKVLHKCCLKHNSHTHRHYQKMAL